MAACAGIVDAEIEVNAKNETKIDLILNLFRINFLVLNFGSPSVPRPISMPISIASDTY